MSCTFQVVLDVSSLTSHSTIYEPVNLDETTSKIFFRYIIVQINP